MGYPLPQDSDEDKSLITYALGVLGARITCTTDHSHNTNAGFISRHVQPGTNGTGLAIDIAGPDMKAIFNHFLEHKEKLHELIHTPMGYSIKDGQKVAPIAAADHYSHVHVSVNKGTFLEPKIQIPTKEQAQMAFNGNVVAIRAMTTGNGYRIFFSDGGVFNFGDATDHGNPSKANPKTIVDADAFDEGYVLVSSDGAVYAFGSIGYHGGAN